MDQTTWGALALVLTILAGGYTWWAFGHRGAASGLRGAAVTLLPPAAYLTGTLRMFSRIVDAVVDWVTRLAFTPAVWVGFALLLLSVLLFGVAGRVGNGREASGGRRSRGAAAPPAARPSPASSAGRAAVPPAGRGKPAIDDDLAEVEAILRKRGIT